MIPLHSAGLHLEPLEAGHADEMYALLADPAVHRYLDHPPPPSAEQLRSVYTRLESRRSPDGTQHWLNWVVRPHEGPLVGYVQATVMPDGDAWVAYLLGQRFWGRGHAGAATRLMLAHLAQAYGTRRFLACVESANLPSIRLLARLGFAAADDELAARHDLSPSERLFVRDAADLR